MMQETQRYGTLGQIVRKSLILMKRLRHHRDNPTLLFLPSQGSEDGAANLRAFLMAKQLRKIGWNAEVCPKHLNYHRRIQVIESLQPDILFMQTARHPLNNPLLYSGRPVVFDLDDADYIDAASKIPVDVAASQASAVIAGSRAVAKYCRTLNQNVHVVWTGSPVNKLPPSHVERLPVVTWAISDPTSYPMEAEFVQQVITSLAIRRKDFIFRVYGFSSGKKYSDMFKSFEECGAICEAKQFMPYGKFVRSLYDVSVGLAPLVNMSGFSSGKSFGKVLAYMDSGVPIITHPVADHPLLFENGVNGFMASEVLEWVNIISDLLDSAALRQSVADFARESFIKRLSTEKAAILVDGILRSVLNSSASFETSKA